jgi:pectinesterase
MKKIFTYMTIPFCICVMLSVGSTVKGQKQPSKEDVKLPDNYVLYVPGKKNPKNAKADLEANGFAVTDTAKDHFSFVDNTTTNGKVLKLNTLDGKEESFRIPLDGKETKVTVIFKAKGALQPDILDKPTPFGVLWALWQRGGYQSLLRHNASNQIKGSTGQTSLNPDNIVSDWHDFRLVFEVGADNQSMTATAFIDGKQRHQTKNYIKKNDEGNFLAFGENDGSTNGFARYSYLLVIKNDDVSSKSLADLSKIAGYNLEAVPSTKNDPEPPSKRPAKKPAGINMTAADASSKDSKYKDPSFVDKGVIDLERLPFSKNSVKKVNGKPVLPTDISKKAATIVGPNEKFKTIAKAIEAVKEGSIIFIKAGTYQEKLKITKADITLIGESPANTIIYGYESDTGSIDGNILVDVSLSGGSFNAENITFYNKGAEWNKTWTSAERRSIALATRNVQKAYIKNCVFLGQQDTLYLRSGRQYFENCYVEGDVDFICGGATVLFSDSQIHAIPWKEGGYITATAPSDTDGQGFNNGYVFRSCLFTVDPSITAKNIYLGRGAWNGGSNGGANQAKAVVMMSDLHGKIAEKGWNDWDNKSTAAKQFFREYKNTGDGAIKQERDARAFLSDSDYEKGFSTTEKILGFTPKMPY